jgi:uncharacterized protein YbjT (DUF2867 family)
VFVGGATGATGQDFVRLAARQGLEQVVHVRPRSLEKYRRQQPGGPEPAVFELADAQALAAHMAGCHAVVSMIGTMRERFGSGDTYAASDVGTTRLLADAAKAAELRHFVLLSAAGAGSVRGAYYDAKREAERIVRDSGIPWTVARPSFLVGNGRGLGGAWLPGGIGWLDDVRSIPVGVVAAALVRVVAEASHRGEVLAGRHLWRLGAHEG